MTRGESRCPAGLCAPAGWALALGLLSLVGCSSGGGEGPPAKGPAGMFTNPAEMRLYQVPDDSGGLITAFGDKDESGVPTGLSMLYAQDPTQVGNGTGTWVHFGGEERVSRIVGVDGTAIELSWQSDTSVTLSALTADGKAQVNTSVDLAQPGGALLVATGPRRADRAAPALAGLAPAPDCGHRPAGPIASPLSASAATPQQYGLVVVSVIRCGTTPPAGDVQNVVVTITNAPKGAVNQYPATPTDAGRYRARIPLIKTPSTSSPVLDQVCNALAPVIVKACKDPSYAQRMKDRLCGRLAGALDASQLAGPGAPITKACNDGFDALAKHCGELAEIAPIEVVEFVPLPVLSKFICAKLSTAIDTALDASGPVLATASVMLKGSGMKTSDAVDVSAAAAVGGQGNVSVDFGGQFQITSLTLSPPSPPAGIDYTVTVAASCGSGRTLTVTIEGSDGYHQTSDFSLDAQGNSFTVGVPGGAKGVNDKVTVVDKANPGAVLREATLTFQ